MRKLALLVKDDRGATAIEYGLIVSLVVLAIIGSATLVASETIEMWNLVSSTLEDATS